MGLSDIGGSYLTNVCTANCLNQYSGVQHSTFNVQPSYDADGNMTGDGTFVYAYDAENRLVSATSASETNGAVRVLNFYDHRSRRIRKVVQRLSATLAPPPSPPVGIHEWETQETHTFVWDGNNIVLENVAFANGTTHTFEYFWGADKSGSEQGAGGVEGLLAVSMDGVFYVPCYDHNGNIVCCISESGTIAAQYTYDPYGNVIEQYGSNPDLFNVGFSTKYLDRETGMLAYQRRFYRPDIGRWLNRDPIEEAGGENLYAFTENAPMFHVDAFGCLTVFPVNNAPRYSSESDFWFAIYVELAESESHGYLIIRRKISGNLKHCKGGSDVTLDSSTIQRLEVNEGKTGQWYLMTINAKLTHRTYFEVASIKKYSPCYRGTISISVTVGFTLDSHGSFPGDGNSSDFGSHDVEHGVPVSQDNESYKFVFSNTSSYNALLRYGCSNGDPDIESKRNGSWGESDNDRMFDKNTTRTEDENHRGVRSSSFE